LLLQSLPDRPTFSGSAYGDRKMSFAVPIILALALAASYYGHSDWSWQAWQLEQSSKSDTSDDDSSKNDDKNKSGQKNKPGKSSRGAASSKDKGDAGTTKRQE
jgi:hypothetical protein